MPDKPVCVYEVESGEPAFMHSVDAGEAVRLGQYTFTAPKDAVDKDGNPTPEAAEARGRARARFMGGGLDQAELKSPEQRATDTRKANEAEAIRTAPPVVVQVAPEEVQKARASQAEHPSATRATERPPASTRKDT